MGGLLSLILWTASPVWHQGILTHGGLQRTYAYVVPPGTGPFPVVLVLHGGGGSAWGIARHTGFVQLAQEEGFMAVFPQGFQRHWNDGRQVPFLEAHRRGVDDVGFILALLDTLARVWPVDTQRIYAVGMSNGAMMAFRLACEAPQRFAAVAAVAGLMPTRLVPHCSPASPVSVLILHGTQDPWVPWDGGEVRVGGRARGTVLSAWETAEFWAQRDGCSDSVSLQSLPDRDPHDGTRIRLFRWGSCRNGAEVRLYQVLGGGHTWPGAPRYSRWSGRTCQDVNATRLIWEFFQQHPRNH